MQIISTLIYIRFPSHNTYRTFYIIGYAISSILLGVMAFIRSYGLASFGVRSSFNLHGGVLRSVLRAPMSFFDTTPTGRILARFSKDMHTVDSEIADFLDIFVVRLRLLFCSSLYKYYLTTVHILLFSVHRAAANCCDDFNRSYHTVL